MMTDSQQLLADYAANGSERAFQELVARYVDLVYSTAIRLVDGDAHRAGFIGTPVSSPGPSCAANAAAKPVKGRPWK